MIKRKTKPEACMTVLSIPRTLHGRIKQLAKEDGRSMRAYLDRLIAEKEK